MSHSIEHLELDAIGILERGGPYPERLPVIMLVAKFQLEQAEATCRWVQWAQRQAANWSGTTPESGARVPRIAP